MCFTNYFRFMRYEPILKLMLMFIIQDPISQSILAVRKKILGMDGLSCIKTTSDSLEDLYQNDMFSYWAKGIFPQRNWSKKLDEDPSTKDRPCMQPVINHI